MRLLILFLIGFALPAWGQTFGRTAAFKGAAAVQGRLTAGLPIPDILTQDFESGSLPAGWTTDSHNPNYGYTPAILGLYSLNLTNSCTCYATISPAINEGYAVLSIILTNSTSDSIIASFYNSSVGVVSTLEVNSDYTIQVEDTGGEHVAKTSASAPINTLFYVWMHYKKGTGADAVCSVAWNTILSEPTNGTQFASIQNGVSVDTSNRFRLLAGAHTWIIVDHIGIATFDMPTGW